MTNQRDKPAAAFARYGDALVQFLYEHEVLALRSTDGNYKPPARAQLVDKRWGHSRRGCGDDDSAIRCGLGPAKLTAGYVNRSVRVTEALKDFGRLGRKLTDKLNADDLSSQLGEERCLIAGARSYFEDLLIAA